MSEVVIVNLSMVHYWYIITLPLLWHDCILSSVGLLPWCSASADFHRIIQFIQTTDGLWHWVCKNGSDTKMCCWRQKKQEQLTVPSLSWSIQSSRSIFEIGILFHMLRTSNITNLQFSQQEGDITIRKSNLKTIFMKTKWSLIYLIKSLADT